MLLKYWCFWSVALEKTLESSLDYKEVKPVNPKGNQSWIFTGRTNAEAEAPIIWPPDAKSQLIRKDPDAGKDWRWEEKGTKEDEMVGWHHWLNGEWVWVNSGSWWWTGWPGMLQSVGLQRVGHDWVTELNWMGSHWEHLLPRWCSAKECVYNARDWGSIPGSGRSPGAGNGNPFQYSCLGKELPLRKHASIFPRFP